MNIITFDRLPSTNDYLKDHYEKLKDNTLLVVKQQTNGRGRFEREWKSDNDLTFSILKNKKAPYSIIAPLTVVLALKRFGYETSIKWPNDILYQHKKLAGILVEDIYQKDWCYSVIGIGINLSEKVTSDFQSSYIDINAHDLLDAIIQVWKELIDMNQKKWMDLYRTYAYLQNRSISYDGKTWKVIGFSEEGFLKISSDGIEKILHSEEISLQQIYEEVSK